MGYYMPCCPGKIARIRKRLHQNQMMVNGQVMNKARPHTIYVYILLPVLLLVQYSVLSTHTHILIY